MKYTNTIIVPHIYGLKLSGINPTLTKLIEELFYSSHSEGPRAQKATKEKTKLTNQKEMNPYERKLTESNQRANYSPTS